MNAHTLFARRTGAMKRSAVRELLKLIAQPGMISFAGGLPAPELFPVEPLRAAADKVLSTLRGRCLQYSETEGIAPLRDWLACRYSRPGFTVRRANVVIVNGSQQALDLIGRVLLDEQDEVWIENPTYLALLSAWRPLGVRFRAVSSNEEGLRVESLPAGANAKAIYTIPNHQNPRGTCLSKERRRQLADWLRDGGPWLIEDNPYGELRYEGEALPHVFELNARMEEQDRFQSEAIYTSTFSKILAPGLRMGYVVAPEAVIDKLVQAKQAADLHTATFNQYLVMELLEQGQLEQQIPRLCACYRERRDAMLQTLDRHMPPGVSWTRPQGGMFLLITLPRFLEASQVLRQALAKKVAFVPGEDFHVDGQGHHTLRLNFSYNPPEMIEEGIRRLGQVIDAAVARSTM